MPAENDDTIAGLATGTGADDTSGATRTVDVGAARKALAGVAHEPGAAKPDPILTADNVVRSFGGLTAVDVAHLEVQRGVITH